MTDSDEWPVLDEREFGSGDVTCQCGRTFHLYWNGGELDRHQCACGRLYATEHREAVLVVRQMPLEVMAERQQGCRHAARSSGVCSYCTKVVDSA